MRRSLAALSVLAAGASPTAGGFDVGYESSLLVERPPPFRDRHRPGIGHHQLDAWAARRRRAAQTHPGKRWRR